MSADVIARVKTPAPNFAKPETRKVLHIVNGEFYAGAERVQDLLAMHLPETGFKVGFVTVKPDVFGKMRKSHVPITDVPFRHPWQRACTKKVVQLIKSEDYEIVHSHTPRSAWAALAAARVTGCPAVHTMHDVFIGMNPSLGRRVFNAFTVHQLRQFDHLTTVSPETQKLADRLRLGKQRTMIRNGVPSGVDLPAKIRPKVWNIGCVGLIRPCKGVEVLIRAIGELKKREYRAKATLVGTFETPEYERDVLKLIRDQGLDESIELTGFTRDVPGQLRKFDLFAMPSVGPEGLPMVLLEAMAHALPTIGSDVPGVGDTIREGVDGLIFPCGDSVAMADRIEQIICGEYSLEEMAVAARSRHTTEFSAERMALEFACIYRNALQAKL